MALRVVTAPTVQPVSKAEARDFCRIALEADDTLIGALIAAATARAEQLTGRALVIQTLELTLDYFPRDFVREFGRECKEISDRIVLPNPPLQAVTSVKYTDTDGVEQTMGSSEYTVVNTSDFSKPYIVPAYGTTWPDTRDIPGAVRVRYTAGWPLTTATPPAPTTPDAIRAWIMSRVAGLYGQRESFVVGQQVFEMPRDFLDGLLDPYRIIEVA